jgi:hypothetical protein
MKPLQTINITPLYVQSHTLLLPLPISNQPKQIITNNSGKKSSSFKALLKIYITTLYFSLTFLLSLPI